ncbi:TlpA family protein disulfide reductase [Mycolicibacterium thermoresistibile]
MSTTTRWSLAALIVMLALGVALWRQLDGPSAPAPRSGPPAATEHRDVDPAALAGLRAEADLAPCPPAGAGPGPEPLRDVRVTCAADGAPVDVAAALAGRPVVLNLWAYWCGPCVDELPAMAEYQQRAGSEVTVLTVHQDPNEGAGLALLTELGVRLPTLQDGQRQIAAALRVPNVMPATVVLRADGSVGEVLPRAFTTADEIAAAVDPQLGESR